MFIFLLKGPLTSSNRFARRVAQGDLDCNRAEEIEYLKEDLGEGLRFGRRRSVPTSEVREYASQDKTANPQDRAEGSLRN